MRGIVGLVACLLAAGAACAKSSAGSPDAAGGGPDAPVLPPDARPPDASPPDGAPAGPGFFMDDSGSDFTGPEAAFDRAVVAGYGAIEPIVYHSGGLRMRGADDSTFDSGSSTTWATVAGMTFTGQDAIARGLDHAWSSSYPGGLGMTDGDDFTVTYEGEVYLEAGSWTFFLLVDNHGFVEIAQPGGASYDRVVSADWPSEESGSFDAGADAWYPIRIAASETTGGASVRIELDGPGVAARGPVSRHRLRFQASDIQGMSLAGFDDSFLLGDGASTIDAASPASADWADGAPADLGLGSGDYFATRWAGQLRIDEPGDYTFRYISDDGQRLWLDGVLLLDDWDATSHDNMTSAITLDRGWHDLVVDHSESDGSARAQLFLSRDGGAFDPLAVDQLRPVVTRRERYDSGADRTSRAIPDNGTVDAPVFIDAPAGAKVAGVEVSWTFDHTYHGDLEIRLRAPDGSETLLRDSEGGSSSGTVTQRRHVTALDDATASGTWELEFTDTTSLDTGTIEEFQVTVHHRAGADSVARTASYISNVKDLGSGVTAYEMLSWGERLAPGAQIRLRVRSGGSAAEVTSAPWSTPLVDAAGADVPEIPRRYFQYRIDFESDGDGAPAVDWVRLDYSTEASE